MRRHPLAALLAIAIPLLSAAEDGELKGAKRPGPVQPDIYNDPVSPPPAPRRGGDLTFAEQVSFRSLDPDQDNSATTSELVHGYILESLVGSDQETWAERDGLATRWVIEDTLLLQDGSLLRGRVVQSPDGVTLDGTPVPKERIREVRLGTAFTFHLRKDVVFHNGQPFTARDVAFTWKLLRDPRNGMPSIQNYIQDISECTVLDDYTVRLVYNRQYWMALSVVGGYMYIRPHKAWDPDGLIDSDPDAFFKKLNEHPLLLKPIGTGPYQLDSLKKDFEVVLKRFDRYWDPVRTPQWPDRIRVRIIKDVNAQLQALRNGEIAYVPTMPPEIFDQFFEDPANARRFAAVENIYPAMGYIGWNHRRAIWKDKRVRWAMSHGAVDIDKFIREVLKGRAERVTGDFYRYSPSYNPDLKPIPYDPEKAADLLAEAGWWDSNNDGILDKDGKPFQFEMLIRDMPPTMPAIQMLLQMQQNLKKLGIRMEIKQLEWGAFLEKIERGDFDACRLGWALSSPPSRQDCFQIWHSSQIGEKGSNHLAYANPELDRLLEDCRRELDAAKRRDLEFRIQRLLYDEQPEIYLYMPAEHRAYDKAWRNVKFYVPRPGHALNEWSRIAP